MQIKNRLKFRPVIGMIAAAGVFALALVATPAQATETETITPVTTVVSTAYGEISTESSVVSTSSTNAQGETEVGYVLPGGFKPKVNAKAKTAYVDAKTTQAQWNAIVKGLQSKKYKYVVIKKGTKALDDTGYWAQFGEVRKYHHVFDVQKVAYWDAKTKQVRRTDCGNVLTWHKSTTPTLKVKLVQYATVNVKAKAVATQTATMTIRATARTPDGQICADVQLNVAVTGTAEAEASGSGRTVATATASANSSLNVALKSKIQIDVEAKAKVKIEAVANAKASCSYTPTPPPPPVVGPPTIVDLTQVNDVDVFNTTQVCATVNVPESNSGTLTFSARFGSFTTPKTFTVSGQVEKCATYKAPTEVPSGGTDTITALVRDNVTGKSASDTTVFKIQTSEPPK